MYSAAPTVLLVTPLLSYNHKKLTERYFLCRPPSIFAGENHIHFGEGMDNYVTLPIIPPPN